ncbi:hypothetical protein [Rhodothalassium salexigens]|uniref:hypothetical protein n=1 Tax=Rhodothalassium salexigens TaxID=1086 RepID=UPI0019134987|nr:hypothetical protein [Rhodothalassium salexigens]
MTSEDDTRVKALGWWLTAALLAGSAVAEAQTTIPQHGAPATVSAPVSASVDAAAMVADAARSEADPFAGLTAIGGGELADLSGGETLNLGDVAVNLSGQSAQVDNNRMVGEFLNGEIGDNRFDRISGINSFMFNTGNNVNLQSSIQVNVYVR